MSTARELGERIKVAFRYGGAASAQRIEAAMDAVDQLVSLAQPGEGALTGWQSIETAPKDRVLLLWFPAMASWVAGPWRGYWSHLYETWGIHSPVEVNRKGLVFTHLPAAPTHWMPLPPPPGITSTPTGDSNG